MDQSVNPFLENMDKYQELYLNITDYGHQIEAIKRDLERKTKMLVESRTNHKKALELKAQELKSSCTHKNAAGKFAIDKTHDTIMVPMDNGFIQHSYCGLCGVKFKSGEVVIPKEELQKRMKVDLDKAGTMFTEYYLEDDNNFVETIEFDPNFKIDNFMQLFGFIENK